ncbi:hypothetical protein D3C83_209220 [compost metagenome]
MTVLHVDDPPVLRELEQLVVLAVGGGLFQAIDDGRYFAIGDGPLLLLFPFADEIETDDGALDAHV